MTNHGDFWKRKLLAFLHDPPSKPYSLREHWEIAKSLVVQAGLSEELANRRMNKEADRMAAAADRIVFPKPGRLAVDWKDTQVFHHPLGGGRFTIRQPIADESDAETKVSNAQLRLGRDENWRRNFFLHWRVWPQYCAETDPHLALLPADTRIPDHTVWTHCSLVSALQACAMDRTGKEDTALKPAFLLFQIGPVQQFIEQARTTRDCWSGSYLLSWLMCCGMKALADEVGPDTILFPALRGRPLFDFMNRDLLGDAWRELRPPDDRLLLTPSFPNRFLALVPAASAQDVAEIVQKRIRRELTDAIGPACLEWFEARQNPVEENAFPRWRQQIEDFLEIHWQVWEWTQIEGAIEAFERIPAGRRSRQGRAAPAEGLRVAREIAESIPAEDLDARNYRHRSWRSDGGRWLSQLLPDAHGRAPVIENPGFAWAAHYALTEFFLAARKNTRDFDPWAPKDGARRGTVKDMFSGKEEIIGSENWQKGLAEIGDGFLFKDGEQLGALSLVKRVWHEAYLKERNGLTDRPIRFDSVPAVAAGAWAEELSKRIDEARRVSSGDRTPSERELLASLEDPDQGFGPLASRNRNVFTGIRNWEKNDPRVWVDSTDAAVFHPVEWDREIRERAEKGKPTEEMHKARAALKSLQQKLGGPMPYVAVMALDGDSMGEWVSGARTPTLGEQLSEGARNYFEGDKLLRRLLDMPRHVSPSYHLQFSEALANFSLYLAGAVVDYYCGQLIYAGGDDVLAMVPAETALACAGALRMAFRGDPKLHEFFPGVLQWKNEQGLALDWGFVALDGNWRDWRLFERNSLPRGYPLVVPGRRADISAGISIGHMHTPLQTLIAAAREAERRAKRQYRTERGGRTGGVPGADDLPPEGGAFTVNLAKRSGELVRWGARWDDPAVKLFRSLSKAFKTGSLTARFPYALQALLQPYTLQPRAAIEPAETSFRMDAADWRCQQIVEKELMHCFGRHAVRLRTDDPEQAERERTLSELKETVLDYLRVCTERERSMDDFLGPFMTESFIRKGRE